MKSLNVIETSYKIKQTDKGLKFSYHVLFLIFNIRLSQFWKNTAFISKFKNLQFGQKLLKYNVYNHLRISLMRPNVQLNDVFKKNPRNFAIFHFFEEWRGVWDGGGWCSSLDRLGNNNNKAGLGLRVGWLMEIHYQTVQVCVIYFRGSFNFTLTYISR